MSLLVFDIARWQSSPNMAAWKKAGVYGVISKLGGSNDGQYVDAAYTDHVDTAILHGLAVGHYWFNGTGTAASDAAFFVKNLHRFTKQDALVLDVENEGSMGHVSPAWALDWCNRVAKATGVKPYLYMSAGVTRAQDWSKLANAGYRLWVASYGANNGQPGAEPQIGSWPDWAGWQFTSLYGGAGLDASLFKTTFENPVIADKPADAKPPVLIPVPVEEEEEEMAIIYVRTKDAAPVYALNLITGKKRHVSSAEWDAVRAHPDKAISDVGVSIVTPAVLGRIPNV